ncbi:MAG: MerR family transcriptional regulator [Eubacterium sp.]|nr:MerR family transcriptional regulator [Eubacterium sp.]
MEKVRYMISDAANTVQVESHVLRYWEEELELSVPRNELGHRYYTQENIQEFLKIKELKERGYQLKAIRLLLQEEKEHKQENKSTMEPAIRIEKVDGMKIGEEGSEQEMSRNEVIHVTQKTSQLTEDIQREKRMEQFQSMMTEIVRKAIVENNEGLGQEVSVKVGEQVIKEMNYLIRTQEELEEERFRKLDEAIRSMGKHGRRRAKKERLSRKEKKMLKNKNEMAPDLMI